MERVFKHRKTGEIAYYKDMYAAFLVSNAILNTKRLLQICLAISSFCGSVGEILYLNALYIIYVL